MFAEDPEIGQRTTAAVSFGDSDHISLCETLDRVLNKGAVIVGHISIAVADVELVYLGLQLVLTSMETATRSFQEKWGPVIEVQERGNTNGRERILPH
jgi:hypothetical protein